MNPNENKKGNKKKYIITVLISILVIIGVIFGIFQYMNYTKEKDEKSIYRFNYKDKR